MMQAPKSVLKVETQTWRRDSHELFDYEAKDTANVCKAIFYSKRQFRVARTGTNVDLSNVTPNMAADAPPTLSQFMFRSDGRVLIASNAASEGPSKRMYNVVRHLPEEKHTLVERDVIKFGRFRLKIRQVALQGPYSLDNLKFEDDVPEYVTVPVPPVVEGKAGSSTGGNNDMQCRICLLGADEGDLITPCACRGSIAYVHVDCLKHWYSMRPGLLDPHGEPAVAMGSYFCKQGMCELCHTKMPFQACITNCDTKQKHTVWLAPIPPPEHPYAVLECTGAGVSGVHLLTFPESRPAIKLGRGHESEVRIPDVSISRFHALISRTMNPLNGTPVLTLEDNKSKFGTLVQMRYREIPQSGDEIVVQIGRTLVTAKLVPEDDPELVGYLAENKMTVQDLESTTLKVEPPPVPPALPPAGPSATAGATADMAAMAGFANANPFFPANLASLPPHAPPTGLPLPMPGMGGDASAPHADQVPVPGATAAAGAAMWMNTPQNVEPREVPLPPVRGLPPPPPPPPAQQIEAGHQQLEPQEVLEVPSAMALDVDMSGGEPQNEQQEDRQ